MISPLQSFGIKEVMVDSNCDDLEVRLTDCHIKPAVSSLSSWREENFWLSCSLETPAAE